jgi:hypothetical protein
VQYSTTKIAPRATALFPRAALGILRTQRSGDDWTLHRPRSSGCNLIDGRDERLTQGTRAPTISSLQSCLCSLFWQDTHLCTCGDGPSLTWLSPACHHPPDRNGRKSGWPALLSVYLRKAAGVQLSPGSACSADPVPFGSRCKGRRTELRDKHRIVLVPWGWTFRFRRGPTTYQDGGGATGRVCNTREGSVRLENADTETDRSSRDAILLATQCFYESTNDHAPRDAMLLEKYKCSKRPLNAAQMTLNASITVNARS